ncbi:hypothetical protein QTG54_014415 [Skeletonema marinoi]|uniref:Uncharacterized protein n=1 Tax=Skeletonema marinoi TaxID=267567 RepID=A0AAD9D6R9_9STRA|nr:hypothetical protein QTG54_014415 [Skeletonema marinoi]
MQQLLLKYIVIKHLGKITFDCTLLLGIVIQLQPPSSQHKNNPLALASIRLSKSLVGSTYQCKTNLFR